MKSLENKFGNRFVLSKMALANFQFGNININKSELYKVGNWFFYLKNCKVLSVLL